MKFGLIKILMVVSFFGGLGHACKSDSDGGLEVGNQFIESSTFAEIVDSVSLKFSTIHEDSIITSGTKVALIGRYTQQAIGTTKSCSYMSLNYSYGKPDIKEKYDSLTMVLNYSGYYQGDTIKPFCIDVYQMTELLKSKNEDNSLLFYNNQKFKYDDQLIGSKTFYPQPKTGKKTVEIRLSDDLGAAIWAYLNRPSDDKRTFEEVFKGFVVKGDKITNELMLGFTMPDSLLKIYSHKVTADIQVISRKIALKSASYQYNQIDIDLKNEELKNLVESGKFSSNSKFAENQYNGMSFIQAGTGFLTRIDFPYMEQLAKYQELGRIVKAILYVRPALGTYQLKDLPASVSIGVVNSINKIEYSLTGSNKQSLTGNLVKDAKGNENTYYSYDVTSFVNLMVDNYEYNKNKGLVLTIPSSEYNKSIDGVVFGGYTSNDSQSYLKIFYYSYDQEQR